MKKSEWVKAVETTLRGLADPERAVPMRAYMKEVAPFLGIPKPQREAAMKVFGLPPVDKTVASCRELYALPEREFHYIATWVLRKHAPKLPPEALTDLKWFVQTHSWWDTVDELTKAVGGVIRTHAFLAPTLEEWVHDDDFWVQRAAILHQLGFGDRTDTERLFRLCLAQASNKEFFIRKAIGWALRDYAWTNPESVRAFVDQHRSEFSPLTIREALKNIDDPRAGARKAKPAPSRN